MSWWGSSETAAPQTELQSLIRYKGRGGESWDRLRNERSLVLLRPAHTFFAAFCIGCRQEAFAVFDAILSSYCARLGVSNIQAELLHHLPAGIRQGNALLHHAPGAVERALKAQPGVQTASVALLKETAEV